MKKISVITINYNNASGLEKTARSITGQTCDDFEWIVVDGGSTDESNAVIETYATKITAWISEKDKGIYDAQNKGIAMAKGEYCLFLNSGDCLADQQVLAQVKAQLVGVDILYGDMITEDETGRRTRLTSPDTFDVYQLMITTLWHPSAFIRSALFSLYGNYREEFKITGDYEFFIRVILKYSASVKHVQLPIAVFNLSGVSNSAEYAELHRTERKKSWELNFSPAVIRAFEEKTRLLRSCEYKLGKLVMKILKPFFGKK